MNTNLEIINKVISDNYLKMEEKFKKSKRLKYRIGDDSELLKLILTAPEEYTGYYQGIINKRYNKFDVNKKLKFLNLQDYKNRKLITDEAKKMSNLLYEMCINNSSDIDVYNELNEIMKSSEITHQSKEKFALIEFYKRCKRNNIYDFKTLNYIDNYICKTIFRNIVNSIALEKGFKRGNDVGIKVDDIKDQIDSILNEEDSDDSFELKLQNENLKSALTLINSELENYKKDLEKFKDEVELEVISEFIQVLNSDKYGRLLDNFVKCQKALKDLKRNKYEFPVQVESIPILIKQYMKFIQEYGIKEMEKKPMIMLTYEQASKGNYSGSPFENQDEVKKVKVESPGWIYKDLIISTPVYEEIKE